MVMLELEEHNGRIRAMVFYETSSARWMINGNRLYKINPRTSDCTKVFFEIDCILEEYDLHEYAILTSSLSKKGKKDMLITLSELRNEYKYKDGEW
jgi:phosphodiesterase/alkaline phosphatase D-like protein